MRSCLRDLFDAQDTNVGTAVGDATVVGVAAEGAVVLALVVRQLADGEIHYPRILDHDPKVMIERE